MRNAPSFPGKSRRNKKARAKRAFLLVNASPAGQAGIRSSVSSGSRST